MRSRSLPRHSFDYLELKCTSNSCENLLHEIVIAPPQEFYSILSDKYSRLDCLSRIITRGLLMLLLSLSRVFFHDVSLLAQ